MMILFSLFTQSVFDVYCLEEATPGSIHTGYYWISYEFVYVGNHHIRNLLVLASLISIVAKPLPAVMPRAARTTWDMLFPMRMTLSIL